MRDKYAIIDAARTLARLLRTADEPTLDAAFQVICNDANNSDYAADYEPLQCICAAFTAEGKRRALDVRRSND
jgi:hypothetical protein